ncbi:hypothetical protein C7B61_07995 [filamentous cyanobacterium CCP1]|nr:hypothetical protein C7B76_19815 [filamentous cyanobacterium CCP2]PSB67086.1 hypothetical protein C7B61_07995 [filamentous cyanobacterium CCP1]
MSKSSDILWLNVNPSFKGFDRPLLQYLNPHQQIAQWNYCPSLDEPNSFEVALSLLHEHVQGYGSPIHLVGHGTSGLLGLLYAQRYPEQVRSLTLFSVGVEAAIDWKTHYYKYRHQSPYPRQQVLQQMIDDLFGDTPETIAEELTHLLEQDINQSLSLHHLFRQVNLPRIHVTVPLLVCSSVDDVILNPNHLRDWQTHFSDPNSRLWICPGGRHFFHYFYPQQVGEEMLSFWRSVSHAANLYPIPDLLKASA